MSYRYFARIAGLTGIASILALVLSAVPASGTVVCPPGTTIPAYCINLPPAATTGSASGVTATEATLEGSAGANIRNGDPTQWLFQYGTTTGYGSQTSAFTLPIGPPIWTVYAGIRGLAPSTTYHFRLIAKNSGGTTTGRDRTFTTSQVTVPPTATLGQPVSLVVGVPKSRTGSTVRITLLLGRRPLKTITRRSVRRLVRVNIGLPLTPGTYTIRIVIQTGGKKQTIARTIRANRRQTTRR